MTAFDPYLGTDDGVWALRAGTLEPLGLEGESVTALYARSADGVTTLLGGTYEHGLHRGDDGDWTRVEAGLTASCLRFLGRDPTRADALLAATEPARVFRSEDQGRSWRELEGFTALPGRDAWFLPYSPRAGAVRTIHGSAGRLFACIEVGGLARSEDRGGTWTCEPVIVDEDIHHIAGDPRDDDVLYVSLGTASVSPAPRDRLGGIARSRDGGRTWVKIETDYTRATIVPPSRPDLLLAGPASRVGAEGRIVVSADGGDTWEPAAGGIEVPMPDMVELFVAAPDGSVWAICSRGRLLRADPGEWEWRSALPADAGLAVKSVAFAEPQGGPRD
jgi:photosystem II stability/assembly factor-like uncharacterized protein